MNRKSHRDKVARDESGMITIVAAAALTALLIIAALVVDNGNVAEVQRNLQSAADSAATAGVS